MYEINIEYCNQYIKNYSYSKKQKINNIYIPNQILSLPNHLKKTKESNKYEDSENSEEYDESDEDEKDEEYENDKEYENDEKFYDDEDYDDIDEVNQSQIMYELSKNDYDIRDDSRYVITVCSKIRCISNRYNELN
jgi:hypothetical protein